MLINYKELMVNTNNKEILVNQDKRSFRINKVFDV